MTNNLKFERTRYVAVFYGYHRILTQQELWRIVSGQSQYLFGVKGTITMGLYLHYVGLKPFAIFRMSEESVEDFLAVIASCRWYMKKPLILISLKTSGTIKSLKALENSVKMDLLVNIYSKNSSI